MKRTLVALATTAAVLLPVAQPAYAASGSLVYFVRATSQWRFIDDPHDDVCHPLEGLATVIRNDTDSPALLYSDFHCTMPNGSAAIGAEINLTSVGSVCYPEAVPPGCLELVGG